ncbi:hypothetical protein QYF61_018616 [Mycteria americana]|uniref:Uncharacterized protein n=1 Tax=Mycteria americana TaxID=33587 RepID=A0AAN7S4F5_MYCAM|nr:hypothetical protein QYF61_018616 [Mycteria americana]
MASREPIPACSYLWRHHQDKSELLHSAALQEERVAILPGTTRMSKPQTHDTPYANRPGKTGRQMMVGGAMSYVKHSPLLFKLFNFYYIPLMTKTRTAHSVHKYRAINTQGLSPEKLEATHSIIIYTKVFKESWHWDKDARSRCQPGTQSELPHFTAYTAQIRQLFFLRQEAKRGESKPELLIAHAAPTQAEILPSCCSQWQISIQY